MRELDFIGKQSNEALTFSLSAAQTRQGEGFGDTVSRITVLQSVNRAKHLF